ncbi:MAG: chemotaxis protein CheA [Ignavibacteriaceae bacterium]
MDLNTQTLLNDPDMKEIVESFQIETKEILERLDTDLIDLEKKPNDLELLNQIFRSFHTIKGTAGFLGLEKLTAVTHKLEDILNKLRKSEIELNSEIMDAILIGYDTIKSLVSCIEDNKNENIEIADAIKVLTNLISNYAGKAISEKSKSEKAKSEKTKSKKTKSEKTKPEKADTEKTDANLVTEEAEELTEADIALLQSSEDDNNIDSESSTEQKERIKLARIQQAVDSVSKKTDNTIRVEVERLDQLLRIASELVLGRNRLAQVNSEFTIEYEGTKFSRDLADAAKQIDLMTNELQLVVMKTRMVKIGKVFNRFPRLVRDLSKETGKEISLVIKGEETELDKTLIEEINDPLVHLIRNSIDHGIEVPDVREKAGKGRTGTIVLSAEQEGNNIVITVEDDGKGIDPEVIREKVISKELITKEKAKELTKQEIFNLIFLPGFSTAEKVTNISGRGVGMDVVKTNVSKLRGIINVDSNVGTGTTMKIKLPLTLAIIPGMIVKVKEEYFVIPLNSVIEAVRIQKEEIYTINQSEVIKMRDSIIPLVSLDHLIRNENNKDIEVSWQYIIVVGIAERKFGIKVDSLIGQKEVVIKSLGEYLGNIKGIAGSTIMGDGTVVMILDINELINQINE